MRFVESPVSNRIRNPVPCISHAPDLGWQQDCTHPRKSTLRANAKQKYTKHMMNFLESLNPYVNVCNCLVVLTYVMRTIRLSVKIWYVADAGGGCSGCGWTPAIQQGHRQFRHSA
jgi:hypothetical protein